jgi:hypothetical protein
MCFTCLYIVWREPPGPEVTLRTHIQLMLCAISVETQTDLTEGFCGLPLFHCVNFRTSSQLRLDYFLTNVFQFTLPILTYDPTLLNASLNNPHIKVNISSG